MNIETEELVEELFDICPSDKDCGLDQIEKKYNCTISVDIEKIHALQETYYYEVDFGLKENYFIEVASGIDTGGEIVNEGWGYDTKKRHKTIQVLKDVVLDMTYYEKDSFLAKKAQNILSYNKSKIFEFHRKNDYDNYVTGGNSKIKMDYYLSKLHLKYIYEDQEVDRLFLK